MGYCDARGQNAAFVVVIDVEIRRNRRVERRDLHVYLRCHSPESWLVAVILPPQRSSRLSEEARVKAGADSCCPRRAIMEPHSGLQV
jgi:hypothetical protein